MNLVPLSSLAIGESATIRNLDAVSPDMQWRLGELGIFKGKKMTIRRTGDLFIFYMEHGPKIGIRADGVGQILVERGGDNVL